MRAIERYFRKLMLMPISIILIGCSQASYTVDNKKRAKHLTSLKEKYEEPGEAQVKTGNPDDGF